MQIDKHLVNAVKAAKAHWGAGWVNLTPDMQQAFICRFLVSSLASIDWNDAFGDKVQTETEVKLLGRLTGLTAVMEEAIRE